MAEVVEICPGNVTFGRSQPWDSPLNFPDFLVRQDSTAQSSICEADGSVSLKSAREDSVNGYAELSDGSVGSSRESCLVYPYTILRPILPYVSHIISPYEASDLLDYFFNDQGLTSFQTRSPYNLATIFRKESILRLKEPRPTSAALLAAILFVAAQTCDEKVFHNRNFLRARICDELLAITIQILGDAAPEANSMRLYNSSGTLRGASNLEFPDAAHSGPTTWRSASTSPHKDNSDRVNGDFNLDHVVTCILCGIVLSGSDLKFECLMWFEKARMMALILDLNREKDDQLPMQQGASLTRREVISREERKEERRRTWWLLYAMDRHLALCYNVPPQILDTKCQIYQPLEDEKWQNLELHLSDAQSPRRPFGPPSEISGMGFFGFFLPCMVVLGDIVELHHLRLNPRYSSFESESFEKLVESALQQLVRSLSCLSAGNQALDPTEASSALPNKQSDSNATQVVTSYSTFLVNVLAILTYGEWDAITMLQPNSSKLHGARLTQLSHYTSLASQAMEEILECDPELTFMPYLLGIYILQAGFAVLAVAERTDNPAGSAICNGLETFIRAHESCIVTLDTKYQVSIMTIILLLLPFPLLSAAPFPWVS
ncbi:hypothetical protein N7523_011020 [Penicillium sp. IBT 18751x]|nr:hypothetical protein N7523_011020 [Penicillium sp. IBT 18751x]